jgi:NTP pyrophosphatase (non-canonical NTP hydrolase)
MSELVKNARIQDLQDYCREHFVERGFGVGLEGEALKQTINHELLLLVEEVGELAKAVRKDVGMTTDAASHIGQIEHELADVLWVTASIANHYNVDLEAAFRSKEVINHGREWN